MFETLIVKVVVTIVTVVAIIVLLYIGWSLVKSTGDVWKKDRIDLVTSLKLIGGNLKPLPFIESFAAETFPPKINMEKLDEYIFSPPLEAGKIDGQKLSGHEQYKLTVYNDNPYKIRSMELVFQFPFLVTNAQIIDQWGSKRVNFRPNLRLMGSVERNASSQIIGKPRTWAYKLEIEEIAPKGFVGLTVLLEKGSLSQEPPIWSKPGPEYNHIVGTYSIIINHEELPKQVFYPIDITAERSLLLGEPTEKIPNYKETLGFD